MKTGMDLKLRIIFVLLLLVQSACISRKRVVPIDERPLPVQSSTRPELLKSLAEKSKQIQTLQGIINLDASSGRAEAGVLTEYRQTRGFVLVERPGHVRFKVQAVLALATVVDMVSDGLQYRVSIPVKNKFAVGDTNARGNEKNAILNLRPPVILNALFVDILSYLNNPRMRATLEETREGRRSFYVLSFIDVAAEDAQLLEKLWIDRTNLQVSRKQMFRTDGKPEMDVEYSYASDGDMKFPQIITIHRPVEGYTLKMTFQKVTVNEKLAADAFELERPAGAELVQLDAEDSAGTR